MYQKILIPLDGSELAEIVVPYVTELAGKMGSEVALLHVCSSHEAHYCHVNQVYLEQLGSSLREAMAKVGGKKTEICSAVVSGDAAEEILSYAEANDISLIAMSTHGRAGIGRWVLGSVADKLVRGSNVPILLVRSNVPERVPAERWPAKGILIALDGSALGEAALPYAEELAKTLAKEVVLQQVISVVPGLGADIGGGDVIARQMGSQRTSAESYLNKVSARLKGKGISSRIEVSVGIPAERIIDCARECGVDLITMSTHGRSGIARWVLGSVADRVLQAGEAPLLLVRPSEAKRPSVK